MGRSDSEEPRTRPEREGGRSRRHEGLSSKRSVESLTSARIGAGEDTVRAGTLLLELGTDVSTDFS